VWIHSTLEKVNEINDQLYRKLVDIICPDYFKNQSENNKEIAMIHKEAKERGENMKNYSSWNKPSVGVTLGRSSEALPFGDNHFPTMTNNSRNRHETMNAWSTPLVL
jgi:hypothetical protein